MTSASEVAATDPKLMILLVELPPPCVMLVLFPHIDSIVGGKHPTNHPTNFLTNFWDRKAMKMTTVMVIYQL